MMQKVSMMFSFKPSFRSHDAAHYVQKGKNYLECAEQRHQSKYFIEARRLSEKAQRTFDKILPSERTEALNRDLAQAWLTHGDGLRGRGAFEEAQGSYAKAQAFDPVLTAQHMQAFSQPTPSSTHDDLTVMALSISPISPTSISFQTKYFQHNPERVLLDEDISSEPRDIRNTYHLARSLRNAASATAELSVLACNVLEAFGQRDYKDLDVWREVIPLAAIPDPEKYRYLIGKAHTVIATRENLLNLPALQSMAVMIHHLPESLLKNFASNSVQLLEALIDRLGSTYPFGNTQLQLLLQTTSQVLDAMAKASVTGISRTKVQEPLDQILARLGGNPALRFQAYYARQALAHIPNDESRWQEVWRRSTGIVLGAATLASAVRTFDPDKLEETYKHFIDAFSGTGDLIKRVAELAREMKDFGAQVQAAGIASYQGLPRNRNRQAQWYAALQFLDTCLAEGQFVQFEQTARQSEFGGNEAFLLGLCQRLEHIVRTQKDEDLQKAAVKFLGDLVKDLHWGRYERVEQAVYQALSRLGKTSSLPASIQDQAKALLGQAPLAAQSGPVEEDVYIAPVWDPAWRQVGTQLLCQARRDEARVMELNGVLKSNRRPLAPLGENIQKLEEQYTKSLEADEVKEALAMYIPPQGKLSVEATEHFDLAEKVNAFLASEKKVLLLLGEGGSGKSTFNRHLAQRLWKEYQEHPAEQPIPLFIPLASLDNPGKNLIEQYLKEHDLSKAQIDALRTGRRFIFILDGYDEIAHRSQAFYASNKLGRWDAKVVISSRPEYLGTNYQNKFYPPGSPSLLEECRLVGFSDERIDQYIDQYVNYAQPAWSAQQYKQAFNDLNELKELVRTPFMLKMTLEVLPTLKAERKQSKFTRIDLYERFVEKWLNRSQERLARIPLTEKEREAFEDLEKEGFTSQGLAYSQALALAMYEAQWVAVTYVKAQDEDKDWREHYLGNKEEKTRLLRFNAPLSRQADQYRFIHKSIQDYLVARSLWQALESSTGSDTSTAEPLNGMKLVQGLWEALNDSDQVDQKGGFNRFNLVADAAIQRFLVERVQQNKALVKPLLTWIKASTKTESVSRGAANAITILVRAGVHFNGADMKGIQIPGADLSCGVFDSAQLQGADLRKVNLRNSWLRQAHLNEARMDGVQFGEWPYLKEESEVVSCMYSPDGKACAVGRRDGVISVYATSNWEKIFTLAGHTGEVWHVVYSPNGAQIASSSHDKTVRLWDAQSGQIIHVLTDCAASASSVAYSPSGQQLALTSQDNTVRLWDVQSGQLSHTLVGHTAEVWSVTYSPSGTQLASASGDNTVRLWDVRSGQLSRTLTGHTSNVWRVVYSPSGTQLASASGDNTVRLWDVQNGQIGHILTGHTASVERVVYSPNGTQLASSGDNTVRLWDVQNGQLTHILAGHIDRVEDMVYLPNNQQLVSISPDPTVRLWDVQSGQLIYVLAGHTASVWGVAYSPSSQQLASVSDDQTVRLWDMKSGQLSHTLAAHSGYVLDVEYSPSGQQLASTSNNQTVQLWDAHSGQLSHTLVGHTAAVNNVEYSPSGQQLASTSDDQTMRLWDTRSGQLSHTLVGHTDYARLVYSPNGSQLVSISSGDQTVVRLWDTHSGQLSHTLAGHTDPIWSVAYSPSGQQLASAGYDQTVRLWNAQNGQLSHTLAGHTNAVNNVVYSPSGAQLASSSADNTVRLWNAQNGQLSHTLAGHTDYVSDLVYSPSGYQLASSSVDNTVRLWNARNGQLSHTLAGHTDYVSSLVYSPSGSQLASISGDQTVRLWDAQSGQLSHTLAGHTNEVGRVMYSPSGSQLASSGADNTVRLWDAQSGQCLAVVRDFGGIVDSINWREATNGTYLITGSRGGSICAWQIVEDKGHVQVQLHWSSTRDMLAVTDANIQGVQGLSRMNQQLLQQRGAIGEPSQSLNLREEGQNIIHLSSLASQFRLPFDFA